MMEIPSLRSADRGIADMSQPICPSYTQHANPVRIRASVLSCAEYKMGPESTMGPSAAQLILLANSSSDSGAGW